MYSKSKYRAVVVVGWMSVLVAVASTSAQAIEIAPGFDLFQTDSAMFQGVEFEGVPLGGFDFGQQGPHDTGQADTIVRRLKDVPNGLPGQAATIEIELVALSLRSVDPVDLGPGLGPEHLLLNLSDTDRSPGFGIIHFDNDDGGTFDAFFDVFFDITTEDTGQSLGPGQTQLSTEGASWGRIPAPGSVQIPGVNVLLNGADRRSDFHAGVQPVTGLVATPLCHQEALAIHCTVPALRAPDLKLPEVPKWSQRPQDMLGENVPSDIDWRAVMQPTPGSNAPNWNVADDFRSDGRPITAVRWWGSYFDNAATLQPEDGFVISFFSDIPADQNPDGLSRPGELLGTYVAPIASVKKSPTSMIGWDMHDIWEYEVQLEWTHLEHASDIATPEEFLEKEDAIYWISITAENGHEIDMATWETFDTGEPVLPFHYWGWHTSPDVFNDEPLMTMLTMPSATGEWVYGPWEPFERFHEAREMAFELLTPIPEPSTVTLALLGAAVGFGLWRRRRS